MPWWDILTLFCVTIGFFIFPIFIYYLWSILWQMYIMSEISEEGDFAACIMLLVPSIIFLFFTCQVINQYLGNDSFQGKVYAINKTQKKAKIKVSLKPKVKVGMQNGFEIEAGPEVEIELPDEEILKPWHVAIYVPEKKKLVILKNNNTLFRWKFNREDIQLQLQQGRTYRFYVHRLIKKNILKIEEL